MDDKSSTTKITKLGNSLQGIWWVLQFKLEFKYPHYPDVSPLPLISSLIKKAPYL